jgi:hypothetical protein
VQLDEGDGHLAREQLHVVAWIPDERDPLVIAGHVAALGRQQQLGRVVLGVQVRRADRPGAVQTLQVGPRHSEVADPVGAHDITADRSPVTQRADAVVMKQ